MTNKEYVTAYLGKFGLSDTDISLILLEANLNPDDEVTTAEQRLAAKEAMYYQIPYMIAGMNKVSEGNYSVEWNLDAIRAWYSLLAGELGKDDLLLEKRKVTDASNKW